MGIFEKGKRLNYVLKQPGNGVYIFVIKGSFTVDGQVLDTRDGLGITDTNQVNISSNEDNAEVLIMEVPMHIPQNS
jgi:redox-sensitive bicupin YhaK (pirin superfamily)